MATIGQRSNYAFRDCFVEKRYLYILLAMMSWLMFSVPSHAAEVGDRGDIRTYTLPESISIAVLNNKAIQMQQEEVDYARANILDAKSAFLPVLNAAFGYTHTESLPPIFSIGAQRKDPSIYIGYVNDNLFNLTLNETVYNGGADIANLKQARLGLKVQEETLRAGRLEVEFETKRLFYGLLLAYETRRIAMDLVEQAKAHYALTEAMYRQGTASKFDLLQSKVQVSRVIPQLVNAEAAIDLIKEEFKKLLSLDMRKDIAIDGMLEAKEMPLTEDAFLSEAFQKRPEIRLKLLGIDVQKWGIEFARAGWLPQITANANYYYRSNDLGNMVNPRHYNWSLGVKAAINVFDGFATKAKVDEAKAMYRKAVIEKVDVEDQTALDIKDACLNMIKAKAIIDSQKDVIVEAKEALRLSEVRFQNGVGINLDVFDSEVALAEVEQNLAQGKYDYIVAKAALDRTIGNEFSKEAYNAEIRS